MLHVQEGIQSKCTLIIHLDWLTDYQLHVHRNRWFDQRLASVLQSQLLFIDLVGGSYTLLKLLLSDEGAPDQHHPLQSCPLVRV